VFDSTGVKTLSLTVAPKDRKNYVGVTLTREILVDRQPAPISWPTPEPIEFGTPLGASELCAALDWSKLKAEERQDVEGGRFEYTPQPGAVLNATDGAILAVVYHPPASCQNFKESKVLRVLIVVLKAAPKIICRPVKALTYGTAFASKHINPTVGSFAGDFSFSIPLGTILPPGKHRIGVDYLPANSLNAFGSSFVLYLDVYKALPVLEWPAFEGKTRSVPSGYKLKAEDVNCIARGVSGKSVQGQFFYTPPLGAMLGVAGVRELRADFVLTAEASKFYTAPPPMYVRLTVTK